MKQSGHILTLLFSLNGSIPLWFKQLRKLHQSFQGYLQAVGVGWNQCPHFIRFVAIRISFVLGFIILDYFFIWTGKSSFVMVYFLIFVWLRFLTSLRVWAFSVAFYSIFTFSTLVIFVIKIYNSWFETLT